MSGPGLSLRTTGRRARLVLALIVLAGAGLLAARALADVPLTPFPSPLGSTSAAPTSTAGFVNGGGASPQVAFWSGAATIAGDAGLTYTAAAGLVVNDAGTATADFRAETDLDVNGIFLDASLETIDLVGGSGSTGCSISALGALKCAGAITGTGTITGSALAGQATFWTGASTIAGDTGFTYDSATDNLTIGGDLFVNGGDIGSPSPLTLGVTGSDTTFKISDTGANGTILFAVDGLDAISVTSTAGVVFNEGGVAALDFRAETDLDVNGIFLDASLETIDLVGGFASTGCSIDILGNLSCAGTVSGTDIAPATGAVSTPTTRVYSILANDTSSQSMAMGVDGFPVIINSNSITGTDAIKCGNADCSAGNVTTNIQASTPANLNSVNIAVGSDGIPTLLYIKLIGATVDVVIVRCGNTACSAGNTSTTVANDGLATAISRHGLALGADGLPIFMYTSATGNTSTVVKCGNSTCSAGNTVTNLTTFGGNYSSIAMMATGFPAISFVRLGHIDLRLCSNASCSAGVTTELDPADFIGDFPTIAAGADGFPVSVYGYGSDQIRFIKCPDATCSVINITAVCNTAGDCDQPSMIVPADGLPVISYEQSSAGNLGVIKCGDASCSAGNVTTTVDASVDIVGANSKIVVAANSFPFVTYRNDTNGDLLSVACADATCAGATGTAITGADLGSDSDRFRDLYLFRNAHIGVNVFSEGLIGWNSTTNVLEFDTGAVTQDISFMDGVLFLNKNLEVVVNDASSATMDFRAETDLDVNGIFLDASAETIDLVGGSASTGCSISATGALTCAGAISGTGSLTGSGANTEVAFFTAGNVLASDAGMTYDSGTDALTVLGTVFAGGGDAAATPNFFVEAGEGMYDCGADCLALSAGAVDVLTSSVAAGTALLDQDTEITILDSATSQISFLVNTTLIAMISGTGVQTMFGYFWQSNEQNVACAAGVLALNPSANIVNVDPAGAACVITLDDAAATTAAITGAEITISITATAGAGLVTFPDVAGEHNGPTLCTTTGVSEDAVYTIQFVNKAADLFLGKSCVQN